MIARRPNWPDDARLMARQLGGAWLCGSVLMGTVALVFLRSEHPRVPLSSRQAACPGLLRAPSCLPPSFFQLTPLARLGVLALAALLFVALALLGWWTADASWLTGDARARLLWVLLVGGGGLVGWSYAAVVTFAAGFGSTAQLTLAYLGGGLPFALVAGMLLRPWRANVVAGGVSAGLVAAGFLMMAGHPATPNVFALYAEYARSFFSGSYSVLVYY